MGLGVAGKPIVHWQRLGRLILAALMAIAVLLPPTTVQVSAETGDRTLYLYHTHTHETARITFKHNGVYDQKGLAQLNYFLREQLAKRRFHAMQATRHMRAPIRILGRQYTDLYYRGLRRSLGSQEF